MILIPLRPYSFSGGLIRPTDFAKERERMVQGLISEGLIRTRSVVEALRKVPRELFLPEHLRPYAYSDMPLPTGHGQTISAPHGVQRRA